MARRVVPIELKKKRGYYRPSRHGVDPNAPRPVFTHVKGPPVAPEFMQPRANPCEGYGIVNGCCVGCRVDMREHP